MITLPDPSEARGAAHVPDLLVAHLVGYLGAWPFPPDGPGGVVVVESAARLRPAWDGGAVLAVVVESPVGTVVSVPPGTGSRVEPLVSQRHDSSFRAGLAAAVGASGSSPILVVRWTTRPADLPPLGRWVRASDPRLPDWLQRFPGRVLAAFDEDDDRRYLGGVGIKPHTRRGREVAVGTAKEARGRGIARRLVAEAARSTLADGAIPLYVHDAENLASARVADAAGLPDRGWRLLVAHGPPS